MALWAAATLLGGALLAPPLFWAGRALVHGGWLPQLAPFGFATYLRRAWLACALLGAPWLLGRVRLRWRPEAKTRAQACRDLTLGMAVGAAGVLALAIFLLQAGWMRRHEAIGAAQLAGLLVAACASGAAVAALEELTFRGIVLRALCHRWGPRTGQAGTALLFAAVHFVAMPSRGQPVEHVPWYGGLLALASCLQPWTQPGRWAQDLPCLLAVGTTLGWAARRSGALWLPLGLHGAWIFGLRLVATTCVRVRPADVWLDSQLRAGLLPTGLALTGWLLLAVALRRGDGRTAAPAGAATAPWPDRTARAKPGLP